MKSIKRDIQNQQVQPITIGFKTAVINIFRRLILSVEPKVRQITESIFTNGTIKAI